jgi:ribulose-phosphate 3-epimerase
MIKIAPSILMADFSNLGEEINSIKSADYLHFDVMDGVFVPNISIGIPVLESVRKITGMTLDVHLMITSPARYAARFAQAGADIVVFHVEAETHENIIAAIDELHKAGKKAGLSIKPGTPVETLLPFIEALDTVLVMSVEPGFGGQKFIPSALAKISELRRIIDDRGLGCEIEVDGGINTETAKLCIEAGANVLVAGNDVFSAANREARIAELRGIGDLLESHILPIV